MIITKEQAEREYGENFVEIMMKGKNTLEVTSAQRVQLEKYKLMQRLKFIPFNYEYVYLISSDSGAFKIGVTSMPSNRLSSIQTGSPDNLNLEALAIIGGGYGRNVERAMQTHLRSMERHIRGEWFKAFTEKDVRLFCDFIGNRYASYVLSMSEAFEGCAPLLPLFRAIHRNTSWMETADKYEAQFMWVINKAEEGLTIAS